MVPSLSRIALLCNPSDPEVTRRTFDESRVAADRLNIVIEQVEAQTPSELDETFLTEKLHGGSADQ
jgi:hypothetical protein